MNSYFNNPKPNPNDRTAAKTNNHTTPLPYLVPVIEMTPPFP